MMLNLATEATKHAMSKLTDMRLYETADVENETDAEIERRLNREEYGSISDNPYLLHLLFPKRFLATNKQITSKS